MFLGRRSISLQAIDRRLSIPPMLRSIPATGYGPRALRFFFRDFCILLMPPKRLREKFPTTHHHRNSTRFITYIMPSFDSTKKGFENLNASNYSEWEENMSALLKTRCEYLITIGQDPEPEYADSNHLTYQERKDCKEWKEIKVSAAGTIYLCLDESQKAHVKKCLDDPEEMWDTLKAIHQQQKPATRFVAYDNFFNPKKDTGESLPDLVSHGSQIMSRICALHLSHFGLQQLEEELLVMALIHALPQPEFSNFVTSLFLLSDKLTLKGLSTAFHNKENNQKLHAGDPSISIALKATTSPSPANLMSTSMKTACGWCLREGHAKEECETKKFSLRRDGERAAECMAAKR